MKFKPALAAAAAAAATAAAVAGAAVASAETEVTHLGQPGELVNGSVVQHWTITDLKPSTDAIPYQPAGTLWEATATDEAISGSVTPIVSNLNARAKNGDTYRVLFGVATEQGVNPSTLAQGQKTTGKIYFDVTGEQPDSVFYSDGGPNVVLWLEAPPAPATGTTGSSSYGSATSPSTSGSAENATPETPAPAADPAADTATPAEPAPAVAPAGSSGTPLPEGSSGTPLPEGSSGTPLPEGSSGTPLPAGTVAAEPEPAAVPAAVAPTPHGSSGTPLPEGAQPATVPGAPATTVVPAPGA